MKTYVFDLSAEQLELAEAYEHVAEWGARKYYRLTPTMDHEDLRQVCKIALYHAAVKYCPGRAKFPTWAARIVLQEARRFVARCRRRGFTWTGDQVHAYTRGGGAFHDGVTVMNQDYSCTAHRSHLSVDDDITERWDGNKWDRILDVLSERERYIIERRMRNGDTAAEVARELGVSTAYIFQLQREAAKKIERRFPRLWDEYEESRGIRF